MWEVILSKKAQEDLTKLTKIGLWETVKKLVAIAVYDLIRTV
jgi:hypothetical protein